MRDRLQGILGVVPRPKRLVNKLQEFREEAKLLYEMGWFRGLRDAAGKSVEMGCPVRAMGHSSGEGLVKPRPLRVIELDWI